MKRLPASLGEVLGRAFKSTTKKPPQIHFDLLDVARGLLEETVIEDSMARDNEEKRLDDDDIDDVDDWDDYDEEYDDEFPDEDDDENDWDDDDDEFTS